MKHAPNELSWTCITQSKCNQKHFNIAKHAQLEIITCELLAVYLDKIKSFETPPKILKIFSEKEINMMRELYETLPERVFNKKQNVRKKTWIQNYNKELDKIYFKIQ